LCESRTKQVAWHFTDNRSWFVAGRIRERNVKVAICFDWLGDIEAQFG
jgi:hypothetical protein